MNPCAMSFRPGGASEDTTREAVIRDPYTENFPPGVASMTPPTDDQVEEPLLTPLDGLFIPDGRYPQRTTNQEASGHIWRIASGHTANATLPSPADSPSNNTAAFMPPPFDMTSNLGNRFSYSEMAGDLHSTGQQSTPLLPIDQSQMLNVHSDIFPSASHFIAQDSLSNNNLFLQSENQPVRTALFPSSPGDTEITFHDKVFQPELWELYVKNAPYFQRQAALDLLWPLHPQQQVFQSHPAEETRRPENPSLASTRDHNANPFIAEPYQSSVPNIQSALNFPFFERTQPCPLPSQWTRSGNQGPNKPKYKLEDMVTSYPPRNDRRLRATDYMDATKLGKSMESTSAPAQTQGSTLLDDKTSSVFDSRCPPPTGPAIVKKKQLKLGDGITDAINMLIKQRKPPAHAPTAPASLRCSQPAAQRASSLMAQPPDATWSQSKRWVSQESQERAGFQKMKLQLLYMGADKSPVIPQTPAELAAFRLETNSIKTKKLTKDILKRQELRMRKKEMAENNNTKPQPRAVLLNHKKFDDDLSPFFATESWFNESQPGGPEAQAKWPTMAELKEDGDTRAPLHDRYFPLPRVQVAAIPTPDQEDDQVDGVDTGIRRGKRVVKCDSRFILPVSSDLPSPPDTPADFEARVPPFFYLLVDKIESQYQEDAGTEGKK